MKITRSVTKNDPVKKMGGQENLDMRLAGKYLLGMGLLFTMFLVLPVYGGIVQKAQKQIKMSIDTQQETQKKQENWESENQELMALYKGFVLENEILKTANETLSRDEAKHNALVKNLEQQKIESLRIQREMLPFLTSTLGRLEKRVQMDAPFLQKERHTRLQKLTDTMEDIDTGIGEKYRKVMEALFVEAEYGNTIEVYQEKVVVSGHGVLGNILRLGRVSLLFLSLDQASAAMFNVGQNQWIPLDKSYVPALVAGVEMTSKRRPVELISLPLGRLGKKSLEKQP